jgi:hypothetical protein
MHGKRAKTFKISCVATSCRPFPAALSFESNKKTMICITFLWRESLQVPNTLLDAAVQKYTSM